MTSAAGRLLPDRAATELSRELLVFGVPRIEIAVGAPVRFGVARLILAPLLNDDMTMSSSSKKLAVLDSDLASRLIPGAPGTDHLPYGSIVTWSTESEVSARISRTYLSSN